MSIERGELLEHLEIGMGVLPGTKGLVTLGALKTSLIQTLTADSCFESMEELEIRREGPEIRISFLLRVKNIDSPVPANLKL